MSLNGDSYKENTDFETVALNYFEVFDTVIGEVESNSANVDGAITKLTTVGKRHKKVSGINSGSFQVISSKPR